MANIRNSISITDHMTPVLRSVLKAMDSTLRAMDAVNKQSGKGVQSKAFQQAEKDIQKANNALIKMGNYADLGNSKVHSSTQKSINQMNILEAAAYGAGKAIRKIGESSIGQKMQNFSLADKFKGLSQKIPGLKNFSLTDGLDAVENKLLKLQTFSLEDTVNRWKTSLQNFSLSDMFSSMQTRGTEMINMSKVLGGTRSQAFLGTLMQTAGSLGTKLTSVFGQVSQTAGSVFRDIGTKASISFSKMQLGAATAIPGLLRIGQVADPIFHRIGSVASQAFTSAKNGLSKFIPSLSQISSVASPIFQRIGIVASQAFSGARTAASKLPSFLSKIGSGAVTAFNIAKNSVAQFGSAVSKVMQSVSSGAKVAWNSIASGIYTIKSVVSALSKITAASDKAISSIQKLQLQNYSDMSGSQAYTMAYKAAQASRSDISTTSTLASRIAMSGVYGEGQGSLEASIGMAELMQKALVLGGGTSQENARAITQLTQGLASGVLQGDELRSIREQSPYMAKMLAEGLSRVSDDFAGTTVGDLKQLGAEGKLTADVVTKAFEAMRDDINKTFEEKAPKTWDQGVTSIGNTIQWFIGILQQIDGGPLEKISGLVWQIADYLQSSEGHTVLAGIAAVLGVIGNVLSWVVSAALSGISWLMDNMWLIYSVLIVLAVVAAYTGITMLISFLAATWPLLLIIAIVALVIKIFMDMGFTFGDIVGAICGGIMVVIAFFKNLGLSIWGILKGVWAVLEGLWTNAGLAFQNVGLGIKSFFAGMMSTVLGFIAKIAEALNKLPFIDFDYSGISDQAASWAETQAQANADIAANNAAMVNLGQAYTDAYNSVGAFQDGWASEAFDSGFQWGSSVVDGIGDSTSSILSALDGLDMSGGYDNSVEVSGGNLDSVGSVGSDVNIADEDIKLLRDMAARDFLLQLQTVTPTAHVTFGDVKETADVNKIIEVIEQMVEEQMATALVS